VSHRVTLCGGFGDKGGKVTECEHNGEIRAIFGKCCRSTDIGSSEDFRGSKIKQVKESVP